MVGYILHVYQRNNLGLNCSEFTAYKSNINLQIYY